MHQCCHHHGVATMQELSALQVQDYYYRPFKEMVAKMYGVDADVLDLAPQRGDL